MNPVRKKQLALFVLSAALVSVVYFAWVLLRPSSPGEGFVSGNGRIEATEIDVATKLAGRLEELLVREGDFVTAGQPMARMQLDTLRAQREEALALQEQSEQTVSAMEAQVALRESDHAAAQALVVQRVAELDGAKRRLDGTRTLAQDGAASGQQLDDDRASVHSLEAAAAAARAQSTAAQGAIIASRAQLVGSRASVKNAAATLASVQADIEDSDLTAPRDGRIQFRVAQPGEVLGAGGRVLNLLDLSDVYMTFFVPETGDGRIALGSEVRIVLDAVPDTVRKRSDGLKADIQIFSFEC